MSTRGFEPAARGTVTLTLTTQPQGLFLFMEVTVSYYIVATITVRFFNTLFFLSYGGKFESMQLATCDDSSVCSLCLDLSVMPLVELKGTKLEWSTKCCKGGLCNKTTARPCLFCGHLYAGGPDRIRDHFGISRGGPKHIKVCIPLLI